MPTTDENAAAAAVRTFRLVIEYDGTDFAGFQLQGKGERTVQSVLEAAIARLAGEPCRVHGAGRTDAGVHALGQVAHFASLWPVPVEKLAGALNANLPRDLVVRRAEVAEAGFHARYWATSRTYRYVLLNRPAPSALMGRFALHVRQPLDISAMRAVAAELVGNHDFGAFGRADAPNKSTVREIGRVDVRRWRPDCVLITVRGNAFLRTMVRAFVGTLLAAGRGRLTPGDVQTIRDGRDRTACPALAPAHGLCLVRVDYSGTRYRG